MQPSVSTKVFAREYWAALIQTPQIFARIAFRRRTLEEELQEALLRGSLRKAFGGLDLLLLGLGIVIGSGWAQLTGPIAQDFAGPSVIISYLFAGLAMLLSATCYAELCAEYPISGGIFSYVLVTFGELPAFVTLGGLLLEYALGMAAVARGFSRYLARLCNVDPSLFVVEFSSCPDPAAAAAADVVCLSGHSFDFMAAAVILIMSVLLSLGVRESAYFISGLTAVKVVLLVVVSIVGYTRAGPSCGGAEAAYCQANGLSGSMSPFFDPDFGADGVFLGAAAVFFTYTGMDAVCNAAEEARNVAHLPWALLGTVLASMSLYTMAAVSLAYVATPNAAKPLFPPGVPPELSFTSAFVELQGMKWMQYIIALAALSGIVTALTVGLFSLSRIVMAASRDWLLPPFLARISPRTQTPLVAQMVLGVIIAVLAMLVQVQLATSLVSFGTLVALWIVINVQLYRRYSPDVQLRFTRYGTVEVAPKAQPGSSWVPGRRLPVGARKWLLAGHMVVLNLVCIALAAYYAVVTDDLQSRTVVPAVPPSTASPTASSPPPPPPWPPSAYGGVVDQPDLGVSEGEELARSSAATEWFALAWFLVTLSLQLCCPLQYQPVRWHVPWWLMPWLPSAAIGLVLFCVGALSNTDYRKSAVYFAVILAVYLLFSLPMSYIRHTRVDSSAAEELNVVELAFVDGQWQPARLGIVLPTAMKASSSAALQTDNPSAAGSFGRHSSLNPALSGAPSSSSPVPSAAPSRLTPPKLPTPLEGVPLP